MDLQPGSLPDNSKIAYRFVFLNVAQELEHRILESLWTDVFPHFRRLNQNFVRSLAPVEIRPARRKIADILDIQYPHEDECWRNFVARAQARQNLEQLQLYLEDWGTPWHLSDHWILDWVLHTLDSWRRVSAENYSGVWASPPWFRPIPPPSEMTFQFESLWMLNEETPIQARSRMKQEFGIRLKEFFDTRRDVVVAYHGLPRRLDRKHVEWLVRYHVLGQSYSQIGSLGKGGMNIRKTVEDAVKNLACLIGLTLRAPGKPGRPRSVK